MSLRLFARMSLFCLFVSLFTFATGHAAQTAVAAPFSLPPSQSAPEERVSAIMEAEPNISDDFSELSDLWETHYDGETATYYKAGRYHVSINAEDLIAWGTADMSASDFLAAVDVSHYDGTLNNRGSLLFRYVDSDNYYSFSVSSDGYYSLRKLEDDAWETLIDWTESGAISVGERTTNRVAVLAEGDHITLLVNGEALAEVDDSTFVEGAIALAAGSFDEYEVDIAFDNFALWQLPLAGELERPAISPSGRLAPRTGDQSLTIEERIEALREGAPALSEDFASGASEWDAESSDEAVFYDDDGALQIEVLPVDWVSYSGTGGQFDDFLLELDTMHVAGPVAVEYGTHFRSDEGDNYYYFAISATGQYNFWKREDGEWTEIIPWTASDALKSGEGTQNRIGVLADGPEIALLANDVVLAELKDESFTAGSVGVFLRTYDEGDAVVAFDNVDAWHVRPPEGDEPAVETVPAETDFRKIEGRNVDIWQLDD